MQIRWTKLALFDLEQARNYIMEENPDAAIEIINRIEKSLESLQNFPQMGRPGRAIGTRELVIPNTPFILPYRVHDTEIEILAVIHGSRQWDDRF